MDRLMLDLRDTFEFVPLAVKPSLEHQRARHTIEILGLNDRDDLVVARRDAFLSYRARLREFAEGKKEGASDDNLADMKEAILRMPHPTVRNEMIRQRQHISELGHLFDQVPEAVDW